MTIGTAACEACCTAISTAAGIVRRFTDSIVRTTSCLGVVDGPVSIDAIDTGSSGMRKKPSISASPPASSNVPDSQ